MKRILLIQNPVRLAVKNGQVKVIGPEDGLIESVPAEDVEIVVVENPQVMVSTSVMSLFSDNNVPVVFCDSCHNPSTIAFPMKGHCFQGEIVRKQLNAGSDLKKLLWYEIVRRKISAQVACLEENGLSSEKVVRYLDGLDCGDFDVLSALEGNAARCYFREMFGPRFRRDREGPQPNAFLNYGYSVLRSVFVRELVIAGLFLGIGLYHSNRENEFPLADDIMEPYRPYVDRIVRKLVKEGRSELDIGARKELLGILTMKVRMQGFETTLTEASRITAVSVRDILIGDKGCGGLNYPDEG